MFVKRNRTAPADFFACEAVGLQWLSEAGGVRCATVLGHDDTSLTLERLLPGRPTEAAAREFGAALARTHDAGAAAFGAPPQGWDGPGFFGPLEQPLPMSYSGHDRWGMFYARERLAPMLDRARPGLSATAVRDVEAVMQRCVAGDFDDDDGPARIHGDLWNGNVMWTAEGAVLIDPAAHGGHRETDLSMLALFGCPHLSVVLQGYGSVHPLHAGWQRRIGLHQLYPLLAHVVLFGGGYAGQVERVARELS
ncbi:fructosamine kinase [Mycobacterium sp. MS1601]|uniref:fructosamine kinase family protein n=1 Tax=Mycobacterium sp. MS1601 TaxID=1936029 RepID=UPI000979291A|nr:fructosamine kinase family protein [Mycobacterium sp. MS1601]AQA03517.1 fructosamine kinase [Mycobacterium sp. MS1601]